VTHLSSLQSSYRRPPPEVNLIPLSMVERVEVLPVAASALYSGSPVGGVINIILRSDLNATEVTSTYTNALGGYDAAQSTVTFQHGQSLFNGRLRVRFNSTYSKTTPPTESELGYIRANQTRNPAVFDLLSAYRATPNVSSLNGTPLFGPGTASFTSVAPGANGQGGLTPFLSRDGVRSTELFDAPGGFSTSPTSKDYAYGRLQEGMTYYGSATYDVFPWLEVGLDGRYSNLKASRGYDVLYGDLFLDATSPFNPFGQAVKVSLNESAPALGQNYGEARLQSYSSVGGLLVKLPKKWRVSLDGQYSHSVTSYRGLAGTSLATFQNLVDAGIYNPLRDTQVYGPPQAFYNQMLFYGGRGQFAKLGAYETFDAALRATNSSIPLPTGKGVLAVGMDYRLTRLGDYDWDLRYGDDTLLPSSVRLAGRSIERISTFGELQGPLLPARWLPRGFRAVEFDVAARYLTADTSEETHVAPTGGFKIDLVGGLSFRATLATSNRFPSPLLSTQVSTLPATAAGPGGGETTLTGVTDPLRNRELALVTVSEALTPNLKPEAAVTRTTGLVFQRGSEHRFRASVDFTDTEKSGELYTLGAQQVVDYESALPGRVVRAGKAVGDPNSVGRIVSVLTGTFNLARRHSQNWTTSLDYTWTKAFGGQLDLYGRWAYFQRYDMQFLPNSPLVDELNHPDNSDLRLLKHRVNFGAGWSNRNWGFTFDGHYFHSRELQLTEQLYQGSDHISPYWQFDGSVQTDLTRWLPSTTQKGHSLRLQLRVNNLFDAAPPSYAADPSLVGVQSYGDWRGRVYSLSLSATF
jgi:outer membrane receptor protein involved in Fe transport